MNTEEELIARTYKDNTLEIEKRIFYTLVHKENEGARAERIDPIVHRSAKLISLLISMLVAKEVIDESEIDALLLEAIH